MSRRDTKPGSVTQASLCTKRCRFPRSRRSGRLAPRRSGRLARPAWLDRSAGGPRLGAAARGSCWPAQLAALRSASVAL